MFRKLFWGVLLISIGVLVIVNEFVNIEIPIWDIVIAILLVAWGLSIIFDNKKEIKK